MIEPYPLERMYEELAFIAYYFHWPMAEIIDLEHAERRRWVEQISSTNRQISEGMGLSQLKV